MATYTYTKKKGRRSKMGGVTLTFTVYKMVRNIPKLLGTVKANSAAYPGDKLTVSKFIAKKEGYRTTSTGKITRKDVQIVEM